MNLQGIIPPVPTPFTKTGALDLGALKDLLRALEPHVDGFLILGSTGEATALVLARNRVAAEVGADVVLVLPPHYYLGGMSERVLSAHYRTIADESPLSVMLYNVPAATTLTTTPVTPPGGAPPSAACSR
jgi:4-hydroxy-2-oxoglutarate aldolase